MIISIWSLVTLALALEAQDPSATAVANNDATALAVQNAPDQNSALVASPRKRRFIFTGTALALGALTKVLAGKALALGAKKALFAVGKVVAKKGVKWTARHGMRWVKKKGFRWVKRRTMRWVRTRGGRWVKRQTYKWVKQQTRRMVRQQLNCSYRRYGGYYLPNRYPKSTGRQQFTNLQYAQSVCNNVADCGGVGWLRSTRRYELRAGTTITRSRYGSVAYVKHCR